MHVQCPVLSCFGNRVLLCFPQTLTLLGLSLCSRTTCNKTYSCPCQRIYKTGHHCKHRYPRQSSVRHAHPDHANRCAWILTMQTITHNVKMTVQKDRSAKRLMTAMRTQSGCQGRNAATLKVADLVLNTGNLIPCDCVLEQAAP